MATTQNSAPTLADLEEFSLIVGMIKEKARSTVHAAPHAEDPLATLQAAEQVVEELYTRFEAVAAKLLGERRTAPETPRGFFARIATMSGEHLVALMLSNGFTPGGA